MFLAENPKQDNQQLPRPKLQIVSVPLIIKHYLQTSLLNSAASQLTTTLPNITFTYKVILSTLNKMSHINLIDKHSSTFIHGTIIS